MKHVALLFAVMALLAASAATTRAEVQLPAVLSSHMVLQRGMSVPVWGTAAPGEKVTVRFRDQEKSGVTDAQGRWRVNLESLVAGGPDVMTVTGANVLTLEDVLVGEVWVGSGQSNMAMTMRVLDREKQAVDLGGPGRSYSRLRLITRKDTGWQQATPETIAPFSALLFSFGVPLQEKLDVPVGLLLGAVGGSPSGSWLSPEAYAADAACQESIARFASTFSLEEARKKHDAEMKKYEEAQAEWDKAPAEARKGQLPPRKPAPLLKPGEGRSPIGGLYKRDIKPFIPYAIRGVLWDQGESGTGILGVEQYTLMGALIRSWRKEWGQGDFPFIYMQKPSGGGCAWDPTDPVTRLANQFAPLPATLPEGGTHLDGRPLIKTLEYHLQIMRIPAATMVTTSDLGGGLHPANKAGYGARACRVALGAVYGEKIEIYGPIYQSHSFEGSRVHIRFTRAGQGLAFKHGDKLQGFAIAGADRKFVWADALIESPVGAGRVADTVVISSGLVPQPAFVRYAWAPSHPWANLFNKDGLPALSFRTDDQEPLP
ncbi:MAG: hypothetical protein WD042_09865 [Phycisphaeraceae bacterium]